MKNHKDKKDIILVLGVNGMLGHKMFEVLYSYKKYCVFGTVRSISSISKIFPSKLLKNVFEADISNNAILIRKIIEKIKPNIVINCIGIIKQNNECNNINDLISTNALFPHILAKICTKNSAKLITIGTDCVFDGQKGKSYLETDLPTCHDAYGMTKYLGEINYDNHLTLRTSIIGHELFTNVSLLDWFVFTKEKSVKGYKDAIFSGFTTLEFSKLIAEKIIFNSSLCGLYQISTNLISKYDLLKIIGKIYNKNIEIISDAKVCINRSLISDNLRKKIKYTPPSWKKLIENMHLEFLKSPLYKSKRKNYEEIKNF